MLVVLAIALILLACLSVVGFFYFQIKKNKRLQTGRQGLAAPSDLGTCARCHQKRSIIQKDLGLCAFCWSSINTKQVG
jgi:hypothetical protein